MFVTRSLLISVYNYTYSKSEIFLMSEEPLMISGAMHIGNVQVMSFSITEDLEFVPIYRAFTSNYLLRNRK